MEDIVRSKFIGGLLGTAAGDSLGMGLEGWYMVGYEKVKAIADGKGILTYTDDTHMMIGVAESLIERGGFDGEHMAHTFVRNYYQEPYRGYGPGPPYVFSLIKSGVAWDRASPEVYPGGSFGNGSAMRAAPIGLLYYDDLEKAREVSYLQSQITHAHELGKEGCALQACAVALAVGESPPGPFDPLVFLSHLHGFTKSDIYKERLESMSRLLGKEADRVRVIGELGNGIEAFNSVPAAIFSFISHPTSFEDAVIYAISLGGDTDTIGAMCGAIAGAYHGVGAIPSGWMERLENRQYIEGLGERLWEMKRGE